MWRWPSSRTVVVAIAVMLFVACCLLPVVYVLAAPLSSRTTGPTGVWLDARQRGLLWNTARLGLGTALLATAMGAPLGLAFARAARGEDAPTLPIPTLDRSRILKRTAGLRPYRDGGIRIEVEALGESKKVVHAYGHGGAGVTLSWGTAELVADLVAASAPADAPVAVLGSGAVGLAAAKTLLERGRTVRVLARDFPPKTTSNLSGERSTRSSVDLPIEPVAPRIAILRLTSAPIAGRRP